MDLPSLLTSACINIAISVGLFVLYSILRKQPINLKVYFGQRIAQLKPTQSEHFSFDRLVPSASWIVKAWEASEEEIVACGGLDGVVFIKMVVFSIRIFSIATLVCICLVLPLNFFGEKLQHKNGSSQMDLFTIGNVKEGSKRLWAHCVALYVISGCACTLLYYEFKNVARMRREQLTSLPTRPSQFTVLVRGIPWSPEESYSDAVGKFFNNYYASSYLSHQIVYRSGTVQKLMTDAEKMYKELKATPIKQHCRPHLIRCGLGGVTTDSFKILASESESDFRRHTCGDESNLRDKECAAAFVFFRSRYDALVTAETIQPTDPMLWVTDLAPEPHDVYWSNLCVPYKLLWIRKTSVFIASVVFSLLFLLPTTLVQGLTNLSSLQTIFPFLKGILERKYMSIVTGYLPSAVLMLFLLVVPPLMLWFATLEGSISRSGRKKSACSKVLIFMFWNVFFYNIFSGTWMDRIGTLTVTSAKDLAALLAHLIPGQASFFMTYIMTSGWTGLSCELMQPMVLLGNWFSRCILRKKEGYCAPFTFPYHTEVPRVLLFGLLGFTFCVLAPLILPFLLVYFFFAYFVYRNQILNVYITRYQTGGLYWPIAHNATIFSLLVMQVVATIIFGMKKSSTASTFTFPLIICTCFFNMYCRHRFLPLFKSSSAQILIDMDREDERCGKLEQICQRLPSCYYQFQSFAGNQPTDILSEQYPTCSDDALKDLEGMEQVKNGEEADESSSPGQETTDIVVFKPNVIKVAVT